MALLQNKPCHFYGRQKICLQAKFELSRWTLAPLVPIFSFRSLNKLGPLVAYQKIGYMARAPIGSGPSIQVSSPSNHLLGYFWSPNQRTADNHICSCTSLAYVVRSPTLKRKSGCPTGINKRFGTLIRVRRVWCLLLYLFWKTNSIQPSQITILIGHL